MKNSIWKKILSVGIVLVMCAVTFSAVATNVLADKNDGKEKTMVSLNPCVATNEYIHMVWQENLTGRMEIYYVNDDTPGNYMETLNQVIEQLGKFKDKNSQNALEKLNEALDEYLEEDYKHSIDRVHDAVKDLQKADSTELINPLIDSVRDFAKTNILYAEYELTFNNSYIQETYNKYYLAINKYDENNYDAAVKQFKNAYLKIVEAYEEKGETYIGIDFGKIVRISYTDFDSVAPQIFLNGTINVCWEEIIGNETHAYFARSSNNGKTWWYFDATEQAYTYLSYAGINPALLSSENKLLITKTLERILIIDRCHYFYVPIIRDGFTIEDRRVYSPIDDPHLILHEYKEPIYIGDKKLYIICGGGGGGDPVLASDLIITSISFSNDQPTEGETITVYATIENVGNADVSGTVCIEFFDGDTSIGEATISSLVSGGSANVRNLWTVTPGNRAIKVVADPDNLVSEGDEGNNILDTNRFVLYKWMEAGNYFEHEMTSSSSTGSATPQEQGFKYKAEILDVTSTTISVREIYSGENAKILFNSTYELATRKKLNTQNYSSWLWINNDDLLDNTVQIAGRIFTLAPSTSEYFIMTYSDSSGNESTLYYSKTNNMFVKSNDKTISAQEGVTTTILSTTKGVPSTTVLTYGGVTTTVGPATEVVTYSFRDLSTTKSSDTSASESISTTVPSSTESTTMASPTGSTTVFSDSMNSLSAWTISGSGGGTSTTVFSDNMNSLSAWTVSGTTTSTTMFSDNINTLSNWAISTNKPGNTVTVFQETFEGVWSGNWVVGDSDSTSGYDYWGDNSYRAYAGSWSGYCADESDVSGQYYDNYMYAYMYRTVSLSSYASATLTFNLWLDSEIYYDYLYVIYYDSVDSTWYWLCSATGNSYGWIYTADYIDINIPTTATAVGFLFDSDCSVTYEGAYIDDIVLTATTLEQWSLSSAQYYSSSYSAKCTSGTFYGNNLDTYMTRSVSLSGYSSATLSFYIWQNTEASYDYICVQYYSGGSWTTAWSRSGSHKSFSQQTVDIPTSASQIRFYFYSDGSITYEGVYIDDIVLTATTAEQWSLSSAKYNSASYSAKCTSGTFYGNNLDTYMTRSVSLSGYSSATLSFYIWQNTETSCDYMRVQYYSGGRWTTTWSRSGSHKSFSQQTVDIPTSASQIRFYFYSDGSITYEGVYIDDIVLTATTPEQWSLSSAKYNSASYSAKCTSGTFYGNNLDTYMTRSVSLSGYSSATLSFYIWQNTEAGYDYICVQYYSGGRWTTAWSRSGSYQSFSQQTVDIPTSASQIRFYFYSDGSITYEGVYIDDVVLTATTAPTEYNFVPPYYTGDHSTSTRIWGALIPTSVVDAQALHNTGSGVMAVTASTYSDSGMFTTQSAEASAQSWLQIPQSGNFIVGTSKTYTVTGNFDLSGYYPDSARAGGSVGYAKTYSTDPTWYSVGEAKGRVTITIEVRTSTNNIVASTTQDLYNEYVIGYTTEAYFSGAFSLSCDAYLSSGTSYYVKAKVDVYDWTTAIAYYAVGYSETNICATLNSVSIN